MFQLATLFGRINISFFSRFKHCSKICQNKMCSLRFVFHFLAGYCIKQRVQFKFSCFLFSVKKCLKVKEILIQNKALFSQKNQDTVWQYYKSVPNQLSRNVFSQTVNRNRWHISDATKNKVWKVPIFYLDQISRTLVWFFKRKSNIAFFSQLFQSYQTKIKFKDKEINSIQ